MMPPPYALPPCPPSLRLGRSWSRPTPPAPPVAEFLLTLEELHTMTLESQAMPPPNTAPPKPPRPPVSASPAGPPVPPAPPTAQIEVHGRLVDRDASIGENAAAVNLAAVAASTAIDAKGLAVASRASLAAEAAVARDVRSFGQHGAGGEDAAGGVTAAAAVTAIGSVATVAAKRLVEVDDAVNQRDISHRSDGCRGGQHDGA